MYRVLIADDEPWVVYGLERLIKWEDYGFAVCDTASNGDETLKKCMELKPDVLISDIRMPGLNGIAIIERIRKELPDTEVVFISGYSEFEYAQKAVRFGAADYLVKQVTAKHLAEACMRLRAKLDEKAHIYRDAGLFAMLSLLDDDYKLSIAEWTSQQDDRIKYKSYRMITYAGNCKNSETYTPEIGCCVLKTGRDKFSALVGYSNPLEYDKWLCSLCTDKGIAGISRRADENALFSSLFKEADIAYYTALMTHKNKHIEYRVKENKEIVQNIVDLLADIENILRTNDKVLYGEKLEILRSICMEMMLDRIAQVHNALAFLINRSQPDISEIETCGYRRLASDYTGIDELFEFFHQCVEMENAHPSALIKQIIQYINEHYTEDLRISNVAAKFNFTPNYLSTLFKKQTGVTFKNYLTDKRMTLAKMLLNDNSLSQQEIVERVGYNDYFQFIKVFKRETGVTPGQYRKHGD